MIEYLLVIQICSNLTALCTWEVRDLYPSESWCVGQGLSTTVFEKRGMGMFVCLKTKGIEEDHIPDILDLPIPLPKPRPKPIISPSGKK